MKTLFAGLFATAGVLALSTLPAQACSCLPFDETRATEQSDLIFNGTVASRNLIQENPGSPGANRVVWTFNVDEVQKGNVSTQQEVMTTDSSASCGMEFEIGARYKIYAAQNEDGVWTGLCSGNQPLDATNQPTSSQPNPAGCNKPSSVRSQNSNRGISSFFNRLGVRPSL
jgi:hypothetical protein